ncbi:CHRD domain-containing protein [uncultured Ruegeria sp.]|uniref:beta strand repeat-containing protein n=1 Tax=uncultured Ruegeria sp. TaxID=259304 RepID=UPI00262773B4|nr:CHRD domain-containing protein [uncultured Ruegeria sp.]
MLSQFTEGLRARLLTTSTLAQETSRDGQTLINNFFQSTVVDDTPAFVLANDFSRLLNFGEIVTNNAVAAVQAQGQDVDIFNFRSGLIEANNGPVALATGVQVTGVASVRNFGEIAGEFNGVQFAGAESSGSLDNFRGAVISSDSRAVDIQGQGIDVRNFGNIIGTGDQRNGTIYTNSTAEDVSISNFTGGLIDAGEGNQGAGISLQIGEEVDDRVETDVFNGFGATIQGRGQAASNTSLAGDGISIDDGAQGTVLETEIVNSGLISTESNQGTAAGIRIADGANSAGEILNTSTGVIEGPRNGLYVGDGEHDLDVLNFGTIQSGSRAVNIDGSGVDIINGGAILGKGDQRNGTIYADDTAQDYSINNLATGTIDAGEHNNGAGISLSLAGDGNGEVEVENAGTIAGRGNAGAALGTAGDGIRLEGVRQEGGFAPASFTGTITNSGTVTSEGANGTVGAFRAVNNVDFQGQLVNEETGVFAGGQNGVYFGTGDHAGGSFLNQGTVTSDSRALNIDGVGLEIVNEGEILGTGNQRNGTVYADGTADNYTFTNTGLVDAGEGNNGSAVSLQTGDVSGDVVSAAILNEGTLQGRGDAAEGNQVGDGLRLFTSQDDASFAGVVVNEGLIAGSEGSEAAAGIRVDGGLNLLGAILNEGEIRGTVNAIDASDAGTVTIVNDDEGVINGNVLLSDGDDIFVDLGTTNGDINGGAGDDVLIAGDADNVLTGGLGNDFIDGGDGIDTADFSDLDVAVEVRLDANGNGTATRDTGFNVSIVDAVIAAPDQFGANIPDGAWFVEEAAQGNLYYNIHTADFPAGEIRGQLLVDSDVTEGGFRTVTLSGDLDAAQEPGPTSDSDATGDATVVITQDLTTGIVTYSSELSVVGLNEADLNTPIPGVVSAIHLHNAPAGQNGPVVQDTLVDAGATLDVDAVGGTGVIGQDVIDNQIETDILRSVENVIGSDEGDVIVGNDLSNALNGEGGDDILIGGAGADTFQFGANFGNDVVKDFETDLDKLQFDDFGPDFGAQVNVAQDGDDAVISFGNEGTVRLVGVNSADLNEDDFVA